MQCDIIIYLRDAEVRRFFSGITCSDALKMCDTYSGLTGIGIAQRNLSVTLPLEAVLEGGKKYQYLLCLKDELTVYSMLTAITFLELAETQARMAVAKVDHLTYANKILHDLSVDFSKLKRTLCTLQRE